MRSKAIITASLAASLSLVTGAHSEVRWVASTGGKAVPKAVESNGAAVCRINHQGNTVPGQLSGTECSALVGETSPIKNATYEVLVADAADFVWKQVDSVAVLPAPSGLLTGGRLKTGARLYICRGEWQGKSYIGSIENKTCHLNANGQAATLRRFEAMATAEGTSQQGGGSTFERREGRLPGACADVVPSLTSIPAANGAWKTVVVKAPTGRPAKILEVKQDECVEGLNPGDTGTDSKIDPRRGTSVELKAERGDELDGRVYHITFECPEGSGTGKGTVQVEVPLRAGVQAKDQGPLYDSSKPNNATAGGPPCKGGDLCPTFTLDGKPGNEVANDFAQTKRPHTVELTGPANSRITGVFQDECLIGLFTGDEGKDGDIAASKKAATIKGERSDEGDGRVYTIKFAPACPDGTDSFAVGVPVRSGTPAKKTGTGDGVSSLLAEDPKGTKLGDVTCPPEAPACPVLTVDGKEFKSGDEIPSDFQQTKRPHTVAIAGPANATITGVFQDECLTNLYPGDEGKDGTIAANKKSATIKGERGDDADGRVYTVKFAPACPDGTDSFTVGVPVKVGTPAKKSGTEDGISSLLAVEPAGTKVGDMVCPPPGCPAITVDGQPAEPGDSLPNDFKTTKKTHVVALTGPTAAQITGVFQDECLTNLYPGDAGKDGTITVNKKSVDLKGERGDKGDGRIYTVEFAPACPNGTKSFTLGVPLTPSGAPAKDSGGRVDSTLDEEPAGTKIGATTCPPTSCIPVVLVDGKPATELPNDFATGASLHVVTIEGIEAYTITGCQQDECLTGLFPGDLGIDGTISTDRKSIALKGERSDSADGRIYIISLNSAACPDVKSVTVGVPVRKGLEAKLSPGGTVDTTLERSPAGSKAGGVTCITEDPCKATIEPPVLACDPGAGSFTTITLKGVPADTVITGVTQDECLILTSDDLAPDAKITGGGKVLELRSQCWTESNGRVYRVAFRNSGCPSGIVEVPVPVNPGGTATFGPEGGRDSLEQVNKPNDPLCPKSPDSPISAPSSN